MLFFPKVTSNLVATSIKLQLNDFIVWSNEIQFLNQIKSTFKAPAFRFSIGKVQLKEKLKRLEINSQTGHLSRK